METHGLEICQQLCMHKSYETVCGKGDRRRMTHYANMDDTQLEYANWA